MIKKIKPFNISVLLIIIEILSGCHNSRQRENYHANNGSLSKGTITTKPVFPYGGVYFRKSNPPVEDWESDYKTAAGLGANVMRHWFMWAVIEVSPGKFDWDDYDLQMDLAARNGIKVIIGEISNGAPEWFGEQYPIGRTISVNSPPAFPVMGASSATSSISMCLDNEKVFKATEKFQTALIRRYCNHPALLGYDIWNEMHFGECFCEATQEKFREWLKKKYGSLEGLGKAWNRYSIAKWEYVHPPQGRTGAYPDAIDWIEFRNDNKSHLLHRRVELFRRLDKNHLITGHSIARSLEALPETQNDWRDAAEFDVFGFTWVASRNGNEPWRQFQALDIVRSGSRGKPFWHSEAEAGSLWMQPQVTDRAREDGRISDDKDLRIWNMISMAGGATGILYPRWRPLLDGPLWGAFGPMGMDGSVTPKSVMAGKVALWANANPELWKSHPVKGDIAIVWVPESSIFNYVQLGNTNYYTQSARGAYQGFFDSNIQCDFTHIDDISEYPVVYLPYPVMLKKETAKKLISYVEKGGQLICEGLPGYFGDRGHVGEIQPNLGLDKLFGAREKYVEFTPDLLENLTLKVLGTTITGRYFIQEYLTEGGTVVGTFSNGSAAAVENTFGKGKTLLIGTFPGAGYFLHHSVESKKFFSGLLDWANATQKVRSSDTEIKARLHEGPGGRYLWVLNPTRTTKEVKIWLTYGNSELYGARDLWAGTLAVKKDNAIAVTIEARNAAVIRLQ